MNGPAAGPRGAWWPFALAALVLLGGWWATRFLCDDAFIAFRYVGNAYDGHGLVWNPAPFQPVEGYSCFLWVALLWSCWAVAGVPPPQSANWLALGFALGTLWVVARWLAIAAPAERPTRWRHGVTAVVMLGIATNATFVTWASSGLETAMFGFFAVAWTRWACSGQGMFWLAAMAALAQLVRPDGGLLVLATLAIAAHAAGTRRAAFWAVLRSLSPLLLAVLHVGWRRAYYGEWVPNTYFAKVTTAWPESGWRYLYCFVIEHGVWLWLAAAAIWLVVAGTRTGALRQLFRERFPALVAVGTWFAFVGYYTLVVGGDHFGFRPFAHLVPLLFVSFAAMVGALGPARRLSLVALAAFFVVGNSFGWWYERALIGREKDGFVPAPTSLLSSWNRHRAWLRLHYVALPRGLHQVTCDELLRLLPERRPGQVEGLAAGQRGVYRTVAAGVVAWSLADVAIVDAAGLNDWVVARNLAPPAPLRIDPAALGAAFGAFDGDRDGRLTAREIAALAERLDLGNVTGVLVSNASWADLLLSLCDREGDGLDETEFRAAVAELQDTRHMAHERTPPAGYVEALRPNVVLQGDVFVADPAIAPLTDEDIERVERDYRARLGK